MPIYCVTHSSLQAGPETTFAEARMMERRDLQHLLKADISVLGQDLIVLAEEFGKFGGANRRIDLLCLDREAKLVAVEHKRTKDLGHMELRGIRYAAMISSMTLERAIQAHVRSG